MLRPCPPSTFIVISPPSAICVIHQSNLLIEHSFRWTKTQKKTTTTTTITPTHHLARKRLQYDAFHTSHSAARTQDVDLRQKGPPRRSHRTLKATPRTSRASTHWLPTPRLPSHTARLPLAQRRTTRRHRLLLPPIHPQHLHTPIPRLHELGQGNAS